VVFDFPKDEIRVYLFLSEVRSQEIAVRLRQNSHVGAITARLHRIIERGLRSAIVGGSGRLKIVHEKVTPALWSDAMRRLPPRVPESLDASVRAWVLRHVAQHLKQKGDQFIAAAEDTQDGVTALITVRGAPVLSGLRDALQGKVAPSSVMKAGGTPAVVVEATPGYRYE